MCAYIMELFLHPKRVLEVNSIFGIKNVKFITGLKKNDQTSAWWALVVVVNDTTTAFEKV